ncbi:hypothetical protein UPYG_G00073360 [Umbra pygmaea]|uniref:Spindle and centriole-associated protein 1 n=1 Tax=Umbra pygmaea TaxID=75934 RepID=A0ABD0XCD9_UMBPY
MAPDYGSEYDLPILQKPEAPTELSLLSQSLMDTQALNELEDSEEEHSDQESGPTTSVNSNIDISYRVNRKVKAKSSSKAAEKHQWPQSDSNQQGAGAIPPQTPCASDGTQEQAALNATVKVQRLQSRQPRSEPDQCSTLVTQVLNPNPPQTHSGRKTCFSRASRGRSAESGLDSSALSSLGENRSSLALLQGLLGQVEVELEGLGSEEPHVAPGSEGATGSHHSTQGLTGFSVALVSTLGRLATLIRQRDESAREEVKERRRLEEEVKEQRLLIDALTAETLALREESAVLHAELQQRACDLEQRLDTLVLALGGPGGDVGYHPQHPGSIATDPPGLSQNLDQSGVSPAVLLSPPRQRDNRPQRHTADVHSLSLHASSLSGPRGSCDNLQSLSPAPPSPACPVQSLSAPPSPASPTLTLHPQMSPPSSPSLPRMPCCLRLPSSHVRTLSYDLDWGSSNSLLLHQGQTTIKVRVQAEDHLETEQR